MTIAKATPIDKQLLAVYRDRALLRARAVCWTEGLGLTLDLPKRTAAAPAAAPHPAAAFRRQVGPPQAPATVRKTPYTSNLATPPLNSSIAAASSNVLPASDDTRIRSTSAFGL
ncbi:hypothetical protein RvY_11438-2 [Ramazzottius varieornatus]|uniref:Uncharacterized protein n=1 Tax=Ramazzottius varieornatus TaxID=947166 RepID=A0A1D1VKF8_RAMVA|nr:hypothetical protein RvY_11438-2 [Ramazzottius varieornatus]